MSITVHLKKHHFFYQELAKILDFRVTVRSDNDIYNIYNMKTVFFKPGEVALFSYIRVYISFSDCLDRQRVF